MEIEIFADGIEREDTITLPHRFASRGIWTRDGKIMILYIRKMDVFMFPGGGVEAEETLEDCLVREFLEETGYRVKGAKQGATVIEYFPDFVYHNTYFIVDASDIPEETSYTPQEELQGLEIRWYPLEELLTILSEYESTHEFGENIHYREFLGLTNTL